MLTRCAFNKMMNCFGLKAHNHIAQGIALRVEIVNRYRLKA